MTLHNSVGTQVATPGTRCSQSFSKIVRKLRNVRAPNQTLHLTGAARTANSSRSCLLHFYCIFITERLLIKASPWSQSLRFENWPASLDTALSLRAEYQSSLSKWDPNSPSSGRARGVLSF